jgi:uncharacterized protein with beta-barrel porin domain
VPTEHSGWNTPNLGDAFKGPGQLLGPVKVNTHGYSDVWSNDISDVAIRAREQEDADEDAAWEATKVAKGWTHGLPPGASDIDRSDFAIGRRREKAREARIYEGSLTKRGRGTLFLTGDATWHDDSRVRAGKLSVVGSHAGSIDGDGGTLGGSGTVKRSIDIDRGVLKPGLAPWEAQRITDGSVEPGNVLRAGDDVSVGRKGRVAVTIRGDDDYTSVRAAGDLVLAGNLALAVHGALTRGTVLTSMRGRSITGRFHALPEGRRVRAGGHVFRISYRDNRVTVTVVRGWR